MSARKTTADKADDKGGEGAGKISIGMPLDPRIADHQTDPAVGEAAINILDAFMAQAGDTFGLPDLPDLTTDHAAESRDAQDDAEPTAGAVDDDFAALIGDELSSEHTANADPVADPDEPMPFADDLDLADVTGFDADTQDVPADDVPVSIADLTVEEIVSPALPEDALTRREVEDLDVDMHNDGPNPIDFAAMEAQNDADDESDDAAARVTIDGTPLSMDDDVVDPFAVHDDVAADDDDLMKDMMSEPVDVKPADDDAGFDGLPDDDGGWESAMGFEPTTPDETPSDPNAHPLDLVLPADAIASLDPVDKRLLEADVPPVNGADEWGDDLITVETGADGMAVVETHVEETRLIEDPDMIDEDVQDVPAKKGLFSRFTRRKTVATDAVGDTVVVEETVTEETLTEDVAPVMDGGDVPPTDDVDVVVAEKPRRSPLAILAALLAVIFVLCLGAYGLMTQMAQPAVQVAQMAQPAVQVAQTPDIAAPDPDPVVAPIVAVDPADPAVVIATDPATDGDTVVTVTTDPDAAPVDIVVDDGDLSDLMADPTEVTVTIDTPAPEGVDFAAGMDNPGTGNLDDLFIRDDDPVVDVAIVPAEPAIDPALFVSRADYETLVATADILASQVSELTTAIEDRDAATVERDAMLQDALETARRAENLALAQNELVIKVIQMEDKMNTAEELVVDLSQRLSEVEMNDPADRTVVDRQLVDLDRRIQGLARDVGLVARMSINGGGRIPVTADTRNRAAAQSATPVYEQSTATIPAPNANPNAIPADVKRGDVVDGYGAVLDIVDTSGGGKLVVMENGSAIID